MEILYTLTEINGEYAILTSDDGDEVFIAMHLLPQGVDINTRLSYSDMIYKIID